MCVQFLPHLLQHQHSLDAVIIDNLSSANVDTQGSRQAGGSRWTPGPDRWNWIEYHRLMPGGLPLARRLSVGVTSLVQAAAVEGVEAL